MWFINKRRRTLNTGHGRDGKSGRDNRLEPDTIPPDRLGPYGADLPLANIGVPNMCVDVRSCQYQPTAAPELLKAEQVAPGNADPDLALDLSITPPGLTVTPNTPAMVGAGMKLPPVEVQKAMEIFVENARSNGMGHETGGTRTGGSVVAPTRAGGMCRGTQMGQGTVPTDSQHQSTLHAHKQDMNTLPAGSDLYVRQRVRISPDMRHVEQECR
jgi:hypothetical protein